MDTLAGVDNGTRPWIEWALRVGAVLVACLLVVLTTPLAAFLTPFRVGARLVPISWLVEVVGLAWAIRIARFGADSRLAVLFPVIAWFVAIAPCITKTRDGDLIVTGTWVGSGLVYAGALTLLVGVYVAVIAGRPAPGASAVGRPETPRRRRRVS